MSLLEKTELSSHELIMDFDQLPFSKKGKNSLYNNQLTDIFSTQITQYFSTQKNSLKAYKALITDFNQQLDDAFFAKKNIEDIIHFRTNFIDAIIIELWKQQTWDDSQKVSLIAVGGYGRGELHPSSDIDILVLSQNELSETNQQAITDFVTTLWDFGLIIGQSVRTLEQCINLAKTDITVITNLIETRLIIGDDALFNELKTQIHTNKIWPSTSFFSAKLEEQKQRHNNFNNTEYNLEPNVKESPGGLRDIQMLNWITNRHTDNANLDELINTQFLTIDEFYELIDDRNYLWRVRYALHVHYKSNEDRLLFDAQKALARLFEFKDNSKKLAVEQFMQEYYRCALSVGALNEVMMQLFDENILHPKDPKKIEDIHEDFQLTDGLIDIKDPKIFTKKPASLLQIFVLYAETQNAVSIRATSIRAIHQNLSLIDDAYRANKEHHRLFLKILQSKNNVASVLKSMKRFGVLGAYIPAFEKIMGQTQHDLFHIYSVDAHTIKLALNIQDFTHISAEESWPVLYNVMNDIENMGLLYLAAIFHDIAKGRGGDHSTLGAVDAFKFCQLHGLSLRDSKLVAWLVSKHLIMSSISQRKDIDDPDVIREFALEVGDLIHLDYLFALTVADINATNKKLWNAWRASLLRRLYINTKRALRRGLEHYLDRADWIADTQQKVLTRLKEKGINPEQARRIWDEPNNEYFLRENTNTIYQNTLDVARHTAAKDDKPLINLFHPEKIESNNIQLGASRIFISMPIHLNMFAVITTALEHLDLSVVDARIYSTRHGFSIDSYFVLDANNKPLNLSSSETNLIINTLHKKLDNPNEFSKIVKRRTSRQLKYFSRPTSTHMTIDEHRNCNVLEIQSPDRPGLLARIARVFADYNIKLINAKISTLGEMIEDIFFFTDEFDQAYTDHEVLENIQLSICNKLDKQNNKPS